MAAKRKANNENSLNEPLMAGGEVIETIASTRSRRNKAGHIERTDRYRNIDDGIIPFRYSQGVTNNSSLDIRDTIVLCQKAYYNFSQFRNVIDLMTEFSLGNIYFRGASKKSRAFFEALFNKLNIIKNLNENLEIWTYNSLNETARIAEEIKKIIS